MKQTQEQWVIQRLRQDGEVSRNACLQNFITRLGAIICSLNQDGWVITGAWRKTEKGRDYVYSLISERPKNLYQLFHEKMQSL